MQTYQNRKGEPTGPCGEAVLAAPLETLNFLFMLLFQIGGKES